MVVCLFATHDRLPFCLYSANPCPHPCPPATQDSTINYDVTSNPVFASPDDVTFDATSFGSTAVGTATTLPLPPPPLDHGATSNGSAAILPPPPVFDGDGGVELDVIGEPLPA